MELTFDLIYASLKGENAALREAYTEQQALILQLVEALEDLVEAGAEAWSEERPCVRIGKEVATAGRARLEGKK